MVESKSQKETFTYACLVQIKIFKYTCQIEPDDSSSYPFEKYSEKRKVFACYNHPVVKKTPDSPFEGDIRTESDENTRHLRVEATIELPPGAEVQLTIQYRPDEKSPFKSKIVNLTGNTETTRKHLVFDLEKLPAGINIFTWVKTWLREVSVQPGFPMVLFLGAMLVYFLLRLIRLADFPIFFFTDEAVHTMLAADLVKNGFTGQGGEILPTFFKSGETFNAGFPVYLQILPVLLGIRSVFMTRFVSVAVSLLAAIGLGLIFARVHNERRGWLAVLILSILPAWFYHSRTAFETVEAVSFYTIFLLGYLKYRNGDFRWLYVSLVAGVLAFYSYSPARVVMAALALLLLITDIRYHWENRRKLWKLVLVGLIFSIPYFRFLILHPGENQHHLELLHSYWVKAEPVPWKIFNYLSAYVQGLNPYYWFFPNNVDLPRHIMKGFGHLGWYFLPFFTAGLVISLQRWKNPNYRIMLFSLLCAPAGAAVAEIGITRALFMVIPAAFFTAVGFDYSIDWIQHRLKTPKNIEIIVFIGLAACNFLFLDKVLTDGPIWFNDYGMNGMQYGGAQVFGRINEILKQDSEVPIVLSPDWANGTDVLGRFFLGDPVPIAMASMNAYINEIQKFPEKTIFIMTPDELKNVIECGKFDPLQIMDVLFYPNGKPGFIFTHLKYNELARAEFEEEGKTRNLLESSQVIINGEVVDAASSHLDMGNMSQLFDKDPATLIRSKESNPLILEFSFPHPITINTVMVRIGGSATQLTVYVIPEGSENPLVSSLSVKEYSEIRDIRVPVPTRTSIKRMRIEVRSIDSQELAHVHVWEIGLE
jgi:hypothetical protein